MLTETLAAIMPLDTVAMGQCRLRLDNLTKPLGSLQGLEDLAIKLAGVTGQPRPQQVEKALVVVGRGLRREELALLSALGAHAGATLVVVDTAASGLEDSRRHGLTLERVRQALETGLRTARGQLRQGVQAIGLGVTGVAADVAAAVVAAMRQDEAADPLALLAKLGSPELAVLTGVIVAAAAGRAVVVLDGAATAAAALLAARLQPAVRDYLVGSHYTPEAAQQEALAMLAVPAYLRLDMSLGGGVGAALGLTLLDAALHVLNDMKTFGEAAVAVAQDGPGALRQRPDVR